MKAIKSLVFIAMMQLLSFTVSASGEGQAPDTLRQLILSQYPEAKHIKYKILEEDKYEVDFVWGEHEYIAYYHKDGNWIGTTRHVDESELPEIVQTLVRKVAPNSTSYFCLESNSINQGEEYLVFFKDHKKGFELIVNAQKYTYEVKEL
jgi:hypothetical protein